jgi:hypothetical protein
LFGTENRTFAANGPIKIIEKERVTFPAEGHLTGIRSKYDAGHGGIFSFASFVAVIANRCRLRNK